MTRTIAPLAIALAAVLAAPAAFAQSAGSMTFGVGAHNVDPKSNNADLGGGAHVQVGSSVRPTITGEYFVADNLGLEIIAALPFQHDIDVVTPVGTATGGSTKHLPPTLSLNYHFGATDAAIKPYVGAGVNYTWFFSEKTEGPLAGADLSLSNSWGLAAQAGIDFKIGDGALRLNVRKIDIDTTARLDGEELGTVSIDPLVYGMHYMFKF